MKKLVCIFILLISTLVSCKKVYTCECNTEYTITDPAFSGMLNDLNSTASYQTDKMKEKDAKAKCESGNIEADMMFFRATTDCELKL